MLLPESRTTKPHYFYLKIKGSTHKNHTNKTKKHKKVGVKNNQKERES